MVRVFSLLPKGCELEPLMLWLRCLGTGYFGSNTRVTELHVGPVEVEPRQVSAVKSSQHECVVGDWNSKDATSASQAETLRRCPANRR